MDRYLRMGAGLQGFGQVKFSRILVIDFEDCMLLFVKRMQMQVIRRWLTPLSKFIFHHWLC